MATALPFSEVKERLLGMTGFFETSSGYPDCYGITSGNHDFQGLSFGVLQFNLGTGSLQPIWSYMNTNYNQLCRDIFGADYNEWASVIIMSTADAIAWGDSISVPLGGDAKRGVAEPWKTYFFNLGTSPECIEKQTENADLWMPNALKWFRTLELYSARSLALMWDFSVQMGRFFPLNQVWQDFKEIDTTGKTLEQIEYEKMVIIVNRGSFHNRPNQYSQTAYDRKIMIPDGTGNYYGTPFVMAQYGLDYQPALDENALGGIFFKYSQAGKPEVEVTSLYNAIRLDWKPTKATSSYKVYRASNPENLGTTLIEITDGTTTYTDTTATGGNTYYYTVKAINEENATNSDKMTAIPSSILTYENRNVDFVGYAAWTVYGETEAAADFGNVSTLQGGDRLKIDTSERLRFELPAGMLGSANTGGIIKAGIVPKNEYTFEYEIRFDSGFPWSKGGKVPGFSGGAGYTGGSGDGARTGDGFSVRMMWREDGRIIPYLYHYGMTGDYGDTFGKTLGYFTNTKAHKVKYYAKLNTGSDENGILLIYLDDIEVFRKENLIYRTNDSKIDTAHLSIFAGGSTIDWNMTGTGYIRLSYFKWE